MDHEIMNLKEAGEFLGVSPGVVYKVMKEGLPYFQIRKYGIIRFSKTDLMRFLEDNNSVTRWLDITWRRILEKKFSEPTYNDYHYPNTIPPYVRHEVRKFLNAQREARRVRRAA